MRLRFMWCPGILISPCTHTLALGNEYLIVCSFFWNFCVVNVSTISLFMHVPQKLMFWKKMSLLIYYSHVDVCWLLGSCRIYGMICWNSLELMFPRWIMYLSMSCIRLCDLVMRACFSFEFLFSTSYMCIMIFSFMLGC